MKFASDYGFSPQNDGLTNAKALQDAVNGGGDIYVSEPGIYDLADCILLDGTYFKEEPEMLVYCNGGNSAVITVANTMNDNIKTKTVGNVIIKKSDITIKKG